MAIPIDLDDRESLLKNAVTSLNSKVSQTVGASYLVDRTYDASAGAGCFPELSLACSNCRRRGAESNRPSDCDQRGLTGYSGKHGFSFFCELGSRTLSDLQESPAVLANFPASNNRCKICLRRSLSNVYTHLPCQIVKKVGGTIDDTELIEGLVFTQKASRKAGGPSRIVDAKIALLQFCISPPKTDVSDISYCLLKIWV